MTKTTKILTSIIILLSIIIAILLNRTPYRRPSADEVDYSATLEIIKAYNEPNYKPAYSWEVTESHIIITIPD